MEFTWAEKQSVKQRASNLFTKKMTSFVQSVEKIKPKVALENNGSCGVLCNKNTYLVFVSSS